jgi:hypothetical protein
VVSTVEVVPPGILLVLESIQGTLGWFGATLGVKGTQYWILRSKL